jgi:hypothetical protein
LRRFLVEFFLPLEDADLLFQFVEPLLGIRLSVRRCRQRDGQ